MHKALRAALAIPATLLMAAPAVAAEDAFNSQGLRNAVTLEGVREHQAALQQVADANGGTRASGTPGYAASAAYVRGRLEAAGYTVTEQEFLFATGADLSRLVRTDVDPDKAYTVLTEFKRFTTDASQGTAQGTLQAIPTDATPGCDTTDFANFTAGRIALISRGFCSFRIKAENAKAAGAVGVLIHNNAAAPLSGINPVLTATAEHPGTFTQPALFLSQAAGEELRAAAAAGTVTIDMENRAEFKPTTNLWVETTGDPNRTVAVGAHLDSVPAGPGINDNGSGTAAVLEIAEQYAARGLEPRNRIRFMWFGAEERGLLGSNHYVDTLSQAEKDQILVNLNFDMIGSPNGARLVYDGDNSAYPVGPGAADGPEGSGLIEGVFADYFRNRGLTYAPTPFSGRSDYGRFIANGIPAGGLFSGAEGPCTERFAVLFGCKKGVALDPCYHQACDTYDNNSNTLLDSMSDAAAHATFTFGLTKAEVVDGGVLRPGTTTPDTENDTADGNDGGGGLHPPHDHDHDEEPTDS